MPKERTLRQNRANLSIEPKAEQLVPCVRLCPQTMVSDYGFANKTLVRHVILRGLFPGLRLGIRLVNPMIRGCCNQLDTLAHASTSIFGGCESEEVEGCAMHGAKGRIRQSGGRTFAHLYTTARWQRTCRLSLTASYGQTRQAKAGIFYI